jgi:opacity protein-like surface antigen
MKRYMLWAMCALAATALAMSPDVVAAQATSTVSNTSSWVEIPIAFPNGDSVTISGYLRVMTVVTIDAHGGIHVTMESNPQGLSGASDFGVTYHGTGVKLEKYDNLHPALPVDFTTVWSVDVIGDGPSNNLTLHITERGTIDVDGNTTYTVYNVFATWGWDGPP